MIQVNVNYLLDGKSTKASYLTSLLSVSDAERQVIKYVADMYGVEDADVTSVKKPKIKEVLGSDGDSYYKAVVTFTTLDEVSGKEKSTRCSYIICAHNFDAAFKTLKEYLSDSITDYSIDAISTTNICDYLDEE